MYGTIYIYECATLKHEVNLTLHHCLLLKPYIQVFLMSFHRVIFQQAMPFFLQSFQV